MRAGKLDKVISIEALLPAGTDEYGNPVEAWTPLATVRGQIVQASTEEFLRSYGQAEETAVIFRTRFVDRVNTTHRVRFEDKLHDIKEVKEIGRRRGLEIRAVAP